MPRERPYALIVPLFLAALAGPFLLRGETEWDTVYVAAAGSLLRGEDFYDRECGFTYPPFQTLLAAPVVPLPKTLQRAAWFAVNAGCLAYLLGAAWRLAGGGRLRLLRDYPEHFALWLGLSVGLGFILNAAAHQQTDILLAALVAAGLSRHARGQSLRAGVLFGVAAAMKCTPLLFAPYLVVRGRVGAAVLLVAVAAGLNLLPDLVARPASHSTWLGKWAANFIEPMARPDYAPGIWASEVLYNQSLVGLVNRRAGSELGPAGSRRVLLAAAAGCGLLGLCGLLLARRAAAWPAWEGGVVVAGMLLFSPMSSPAHFGLLLLPAFALARLAVAGRHLWAWPLLTVLVGGSVLTNKDLWGERLHTAGLWYGTATWATAAVLLGCVAALVTGAEVAQKAAEPPAEIFAARGAIAGRSQGRSPRTGRAAARKAA